MLKLRTRIALIFSFFVIVAVITLVILFNISLKSSLKEKPLVEKIYPNGVYVTVHGISKESILFEPKLKVLPENLTKTNINTVQLDNLLVNELSKRLIWISLITIFVIISITFFISKYISSLAMKPIRSVSKMIDRMSPEKLELFSEKPKTDYEMVKLTQTYNNAIKRLNRTYTDLERFNSYASHEIRNSLAILKSKIEIDCEKKELNKYVDNLKKTIDDMLIISSRQINDKGELVDMALVAAQGVDEYLSTGRKIELEIPEEGVSPVVGKEVWLHRSICNLLDNAIKYSDKDKPIIVNVKEYLGSVIVSVKDFGKGIPEKEQEYIWKPYYSIPNSKKNGYGIGLALIKNAVDLCNGFVWVESSAGEGSTFYISLPVSLC